MARKTRDPRWIRSRFPSTCGRCFGTIEPGGRAYFYPLTRSILCERDECGGQVARDFAAAAFDEAVS
jgi:hypothetical protein